MTPSSAVRIVHAVAAVTAIFMAVCVYPQPPSATPPPTTVLPPADPELEELRDAFKAAETSEARAEAFAKYVAALRARTPPERKRPVRAVPRNYTLIAPPGFGPDPAEQR
jgi:hypothetical protein